MAWVRIPPLPFFFLLPLQNSLARFAANMNITALHFCPPPSSLSAFLLPLCLSSSSLFLFLVTTRFDHLQSLGKRVSSSSRAEGDVRERMKQLTMERAALRDAWEKRSKQLKQCSELQVCKDTFNQVPVIHGCL